MPDEADCIDQGVLHNALAAYRQLSAEERARVMNGWQIGPYFPTRRDVLWQNDVGTLSVAGVAIMLGEKTDTAFPTCISGESNLEPVQVQIVAGTDRDFVLHCLERAMRMIDRCWPQMAGGVTIISNECGDAFYFESNEKERSETAANSRPPGQLPGTKAAESKTAPNARDNSDTHPLTSTRKSKPRPAMAVA